MICCLLPGWRGTKKWLELHDKVVAKTFEDAVNTAIELVDLVNNEFNDNLIPKYEKYIGENSQKLTSSPFLC